MTHPHVTDASRDDILDLGTITHPSRSEEAMDRPQVITRQALENPPAEQTTNLQRGQAFAHDGVWAGFANFPGGATTGWHHRLHHQRRDDGRVRARGQRAGRDRRG